MPKDDDVFTPTFIITYALANDVAEQVLAKHTAEDRMVLLVGAAIKFQGWFAYGVVQCFIHVLATCGSVGC